MHWTGNHQVACLPDGERHTDTAVTKSLTGSSQTAMVRNPQHAGGSEQLAYLSTPTVKAPESLSARLHG
jgi:hypothetical protein